MSRKVLHTCMPCSRCTHVKMQSNRNSIHTVVKHAQLFTGAWSVTGACCVTDVRTCNITTQQLVSAKQNENCSCALSTVVRCQGFLLGWTTETRMFLHGLPRPIPPHCNCTAPAIVFVLRHLGRCTGCGTRGTRATAVTPALLHNRSEQQHSKAQDAT
jgi:hypothetical protein